MSEKPCNDVVSLKQRYSDMKEDLTEIKQDVKAMSNKVTTIEERLSGVKQKVNGFGNDYKYDTRKRGDRNWALWIMLISIAVSSLASIVVTIMKG